MVSKIFLQITDTLSKRPEYGIASSLLSVTMNPTELMQFIGMALGIVIAGITAILKIIELRDRLKDRKFRKLQD